MIKETLTNLARDLNDKEETIEYAISLTEKTLMVFCTANERNLFVAALIIASRLKRDDILSARTLTKHYEVSYSALTTPKGRILKANDIEYVGTIIIKKYKKPLNRQFLH